jgi:glutathione S-transferase
MHSLDLVSHDLCPYVQRAAITLAEKHARFTRTYVDLTDKPDWFRVISPLGKVPLLRIGESHVLFESAVICEFVDEILPPRLLPDDPLARARERSWIAVASTALETIAACYSAPDANALDRHAMRLRRLFEQVENAISRTGPWFAGNRFGLVDAAFAPVFRYFDIFDEVAESVVADLTQLAAWRRALAARPSVKAAVADDFGLRLERFLSRRDSHLGRLVAARRDAGSLAA